MLAKKLGMTQIFREDGHVLPVTVLEAEPNKVIQVKTVSKDGYQALQVGAFKAKKLSKPLQGHMKDLGFYKHLREFKEMKIGDKELVRGDEIDISTFKQGDKVKITGISKGKGFAGAIKRHGFKGMPASHGHSHVQRRVGSIGQRFPQHTLKGMRGPGRTGAAKSTIRGLSVVSVDKNNNTMVVKGAVPGNKGGLVIVQKMT